MPVIMDDFGFPFDTDKGVRAGRKRAPNPNSPKAMKAAADARQAEALQRDLARNAAARNASKAAAQGIPPGPRVEVTGNPAANKPVGNPGLKPGGVGTAPPSVTPPGVTPGAAAAPRGFAEGLKQGLKPSTPHMTLGQMVPGQGALTKLGSGIGKVAGGLGRFNVASSGIAGAISGYNTSTDDYAKRFGIDLPEGEGFLAEAKRTGIRALGVASDVGNAMTLGGLEAVAPFRDKEGKVATPTAPDTATAAAAQQEAARKAEIQAVVDAQNAKMAAPGFTPERDGKGTLGQAMDAGVKGMPPPRDPHQMAVATAVAQNRDATEMPVKDGEGFLTGTDADGVRRTIRGYNGMPVNGITDTSTPEQKAQDAANRAKWTAESKAIDDRMAARDEAAWNNRERMNLRNNQLQADYDLRTLSDPKNTFRDEKAIKVAALRSGAAQDAIKGFDANQTELTRSKQNSDALRYNADQGLRGHMATAEASLLGHKLSADATVQAAQIKGMQDAWKQRLDANKDNRAEYDGVLTAAFTKKDDKGKDVHDPVAAQEFEKWVTTKTFDPKFRESLKINSPEEINKFQWKALADTYKKEMALASAAGVTDRGPATRASIGDISWSDLAPSFSQDKVENKVGVRDVFNAKVNPFTTGTVAEKALTVGFKDGRPVKVSAAGATPEQISQAIQHERRQGNTKKADELERVYNTTRQAFGG
jgi:hypothetical protein